MELNKVVVLALAVVLVASLASAGVSGNLVLLAKKSHSSGSDSGSSSGSSDSGSSDSGSKDKGSDKSSSNGDNGSPTSSPDIPKSEPAKVPDIVNPSDNPSPKVNLNPDSPIVPAPNPNPNPDKGGVSCTPEGHDANCNPIHQPDNGCAFNPDSDKCKPDTTTGKCPDGFGMNDKGNCFPSGPCPTGFGRKDNDESGRCFPNHQPGNFCLFHNCLGIHTHTTVVVHQTKVVHKKELGVGIPTVFVPKIGLVEPLNCKLNENSGKINCEFVIIKVIN